MKHRNLADKNTSGNLPSQSRFSKAFIKRLSSWLVVSTAWSVGLWQCARAVSIYWDADGSAAGDNIDGTGLGGTGAWDIGAGNWWDGAALINWPNNDGDQAIFTGPYVAGVPAPNTVTVSSGIKANRLSFLRSGYSLTGGDLTLSGLTPTLQASIGESATINSQLLGTAGVTMTGRGAIRLANATNSFTGPTTISGGSLIVSSQAALGADTSAIVVTGAAARGSSGGSLVLDGTSAGMTLTRDLSLQGLGPIADRSAALISVGNNTLSGTVTTGVGLVNTRVTSATGLLTLSGTLSVAGTAGTTVSIFGGASNQAGVGLYSLTGALTGTGTLEKSGAGTLFLTPSATAGFAGSLRLSTSATGTTSTVRITTPNVLGTRVATGTGAVLDLNGGFLEVLMDVPSVLAGGAPAALYGRGNTTTIFVDHSPAGSAINGTLTFGQMSFEANTGQTFASRNGYGVTIGAAPVVTATNNSTITNNLLGGGVLTFTGAFWSQTNNTANRTMTIAGNGPTVISGNVTASAAAFDHNLTKSGTGVLTITSTGSTLDGALTVAAGTVAITDFRSINNNTSTINLGATTVAGTLTIGTTTAATAAGLTTSKVINLAGTTGGAAINASQTLAAPVILNGAFTGTGVGAKTLTLGGTSLQNNIINGAIVDSTTGVTSLVKADPGTWVLAAPGTGNTYTGSTTITAGTLRLKANAATTSTVVGQAGTNTVIFNSNAATFTAGGTLELLGFSGAATTETLGALTPTAGAGTVRLTADSGTPAATSLVFTSLGAVGKGTGVNFDTANGSGGTVTVTGLAAATATTLPGNGHLYFNGANFAISTGGVLGAPTYTAAGAIFTTAPAGAATLTAGRHNEVTGLITAQTAVSVTSLKLTTFDLTLADKLTVNTGGVANDGGILQTGGSAAINGPGLISTGGAGTLVFRVNGATDVLQLNTSIQSDTTGGFTKNGAGRLVINAVNAQTGTTTLNEGTVQLLGSGRLSAANAALDIRQGATLDLNGLSSGVAIGALNGAGTITNSNPAPATLIVGNGTTGAGTFTGLIQDGIGVVHVTKTGTTGAPTWSGLNTYTGVTTIGGTTGLVSVTNLANYGTASSIGRGLQTLVNDANNAASLVFEGTTGGLNYTGTTSVSIDRLFTLNGSAAGSGAQIANASANNAALILNKTNAIAFGAGATVAQTLTLGGASTADSRINLAIVDNGALRTSLTKIGAGVWHLGGTNTYTGVTTITAGQLGSDGVSTLPANSPLSFNGGSLLSSGNFVRNLVATATPGNPDEVTWAAGGGFAAGSAPLVVALGGIATPTALTWASGGFVTTGNLTLNSATALSDVDIRNAIDLNAGNRTVQVDDNANTAADFATISGVISGVTASLTKSGGGILRLTGANTYDGNTNVTAGTLVVRSLGNSTTPGATSVGSSAAGNTDAGAIVLGNTTTTGGLLQYVGSGETSDRKIRLQGTTAGNQIHADGTGPLILTNVAHDTTITGNKTLSLRGTNTAGNMITSVLTDNGTGVLSVTVDGGGTWILNNSLNAYTGVTTASAGALGIGDNAALGTGIIALDSGNIFAYGGDRTLANPLRQNNNTTVAFIGDQSVFFSSTLAQSAGANNFGITNNIAGGKSLTFNNGTTANSLTANRNFTLDGTGETFMNGDFTTSTVFGVALIKTGTGTLNLGGSTGSNFNRNNATLDVDNGVLKLSANEVIPDGFTATSATAAPVAASTTITVGSTTGLVVGQLITGTGVTAGATVATIVDGTTFTASAAQTLAAGVPLVFDPRGNVTLSPELATSDVAVFDLNGRTETINGLTSTTDGTAIIDNTAATPGSLTFGANNSAVNFGGGVGTYRITDTGAGTLSITKTGTASITIPNNVALTYQGSTNVTGGSMNLAAALNGSTGLAVRNSGSTLALTGGITAPAAITSIVVENGATLSLLDGTGNKLTGLTTLRLGSTGGTLTTLSLNVGDGVLGDDATTDTLTLASGGTLSLFTGNTITFNLTDIGLNANQQYVLLDATAIGGGFFGGASPLPSIASYTLSGVPGGFTSIDLATNSTTNQIILTTGNLITGASYWRGATNNTWNANANNWSLDKLGATPAASIPGSGTDVIFAYDGIGAGALVTTLEQNFRINSLTFEAGATTPLSVTIDPGTIATNRIDIAPLLATAGIKISAGGPATVTISGPVRLGANQTWDVADAASVLSLGSLSGQADVTKTGLGKVTLTAAADTTFNAGDTTDLTISAGTLEMTNVAALGNALDANFATVTVNSTGAFYYNGVASSATNLAMALTLAGGTLSAGTANQIYSGPVNVSADSFINLRDSNAGVTTTSARSITHSGVLSGAGKLMVDSIVTLTAGNPLSGTLTLSNANSGWSGGIDLVRGTVTASNVDGFGTGNINVSGSGRITGASAGGTTFNLSQNVTLNAPGGIFEISADASGTPVSDMTMNFNGVVTIGSVANANNALRLFLATDNFSVINLTNSVVLGNNASISVAGSTTRAATISGVISETGGARTLAVNDDLGLWAQTNRILRLTGLNTFSGNLTVDSGILEFDTVTNAAGAPSSLGQGSAITMGIGAATLRFIGGTSQSTDRPITTTTGGQTLSANGTGGATITYTGAITVGPTADGTQFTLTGIAGSTGVLTGGFTQTGDTADAAVSGGTWNLNAGTSRVGDDLTVNAGAILNLNGGLLQVRDDFIVTGVGAVLNLNATGALTFDIPTLSADALLESRAGGTIVLGANNPVVLSQFDSLRIGTNADGVGTLEMGAFNWTINEFLLANRNLLRTGTVNGSGTLTVTGNFDLYRGTINAPLASTGTNTLDKLGLGIVTLKGNNSGLASTGATVVAEGTLVLDYTVDNNAKIGVAAALDLRGGTLQIIGNASAATSQTVAGLTLATGGSSTMQITGGAGQDAVLNLGAITRGNNAQDGTIRFILPTGTQSATNGFTTTTLNTSGILGGYATVRDGTGASFATNATNLAGGNIVALASTVKNDVTTWLPGDNITDDTTGFTSPLLSANINSLRFDAAVGSDVSMPQGGVLLLGSGGLLITSNVAGTPSIAGGTLASGATEIIVTQDSAQTFEISSDIRINLAVTKSGTGTLLLSGNNVYTGATEIQEGTLRISGGTAIGDTSLVTLGATRPSTLELLTDETIGRLAGGQRQVDSENGLVAIGANTLTINQSASTSYGGFITGTGNLVMNAGSVGNLNLQNVSSGFTGAVTVNGGLFQLSNTGQINASSITINRTAAMLLDNNSATRSGTRILDTTPINLHSADGTFSGATAPRGLAFRTDQNSGTTNTETIGALNFVSGASYGTLEQSGGDSSRAIVQAGNFVRTNAATFSVRGRALGSNAATLGQSQLKIVDGANEVAFLATLVGGVDYTPAALNNKIVPWAIAQNLTGGLVDGNMGNSLATYIDNRGFAALDFATEYSTYTASTVATDNIRESLAADLTGLAGKTINSLVINNDNAPTLNVTGTGAGQVLANTSGTLLFTLTNGVATAPSTAYNTVLGGFDNGITVGATNEYILQVVNPSSVTAASPNMTAGSTTTGSTTVTVASTTGLVAGMTVVGTGIPAGATVASVTNTTTFVLSVAATETNTGLIFAPSAPPTLTATISSPLTSIADITKSGRGTLILNGTQTAGGGLNKTTLNEGILQIADLDNIGGNTGGLVFAGGTLRLGAGFTDDLSLRTISFLNGGGTINTNGLDLALANSLGSGTGGLTKTGAGNLTLNAVATYTGPTTISAGTVTVGATNALGVGGNLSIVGSSVLALGTNGISHGLVTTSGAAAGNITGTGTINASQSFFLNHTGDTTIDAILASAGGLLKAQANVVTLTGANTYAGTTEVQNGTLSFATIGNVGGGATNLGAPTTIENGIIRMGLTTAATALTYTGAGSSTDRIIEMQGTTGGVSINGNGTGALALGTIQSVTNGNKTLTLRGTSLPAVLNSVASVKEVGTVLSVAKADANLWQLTGTSTYTGATTVSAGELRVALSGSLANTSSATVAAGATLRVDGAVNLAALITVNGTLAGTGTVGPVTTAGAGDVSPGNSPGILNTGNFSLTAGTSVTLELAGVTAGNGASNHDQVRVTGSVTLAGDARVTLFGGYYGTAVPGDTFFVILNDGSDPVAGTFANAPTEGSTLTGIDGSQFTVSYFANGDAGGIGNDVQLTLLSIPEPNALAMLASSLGMALGLQRFRRRQSQG